MKKKSILILFVTLFLELVYLFWRLYCYFKTISKLEKDLPQILLNKLGVKTEVRFIITYDQTVIEILNISEQKIREGEMVQAVKKHIIENHPLIKINKVSIKIV